VSFTVFKAFTGLFSSLQEKPGASVLNQNFKNGVKKTRLCEPGSMHFGLTVLFSSDPLFSVLSFSF
jgi:hypothetical protein